MTQEEIIELAKQAGVEDSNEYNHLVCTEVELVAFAKLVAEAEREACAKLCDLAMLQNQETINELEEDEHIAQCFIQGAMTQLVKTSKAIRERGKE